MVNISPSTNITIVWTTMTIFNQFIRPIPLYAARCHLDCHLTIITIVPICFGCSLVIIVRIFWIDIDPKTHYHCTRWRKREGAKRGVTWSWDHSSLSYITRYVCESHGMCASHAWTHAHPNSYGILAITFPYIQDTSAIRSINRSWENSLVAQSLIADSGYRM